ncbi:MarR family winged helix-turn-helix transcriptional regulator [Bifidobacterium panos]|uniref:MarR family transcriptional regulator n=1 Tax=Bifidobacterium panos TaxID=2675321 RepID=A0ABX1SX69_9BIFI|nr:MarR family transcriptional regulator [Bifidobacterium sp. DSM 109963]NMN02420.1 MarR family transcriptional regulator [Bifidobacterium sp. DSM 109963]
MGFEREMFDELMSNIWDKRSRMQQEISRGTKGEPFVVQELSRKGPQTPSQLAQAMKATTGRISTLLSVLEKKGQIVREADPADRRIVHVSLTQAGERRARKQRDEMREAVCWIFSQMGERRTREFVDLSIEFTTYMSLCMPGKPRPTPEEVRAAFAQDEV